jgi:hypothetical protein
MTYYDLLKQYVSRGQKISEEQLEKLSKLKSELLTTYYRSAIKNMNNEDRLSFSDYELKYLNKSSFKTLEFFLSKLNEKGFAFVLGMTKNTLDILSKRKMPTMSTRELVFILRQTENPELFMDYMIDENGRNKLNEFDNNAIISIFRYTTKPEFFYPFFKNTFFNLKDHEIGINLYIILTRTPKPEFFLPILFNLNYRPSGEEITNMLVENPKPEEILKYVKDRLMFLDTIFLRIILVNTDIPHLIIPHIEKVIRFLNKEDVLAIMKSKNADVLRPILEENNLI